MTGTIDHPELAALLELWTAHRRQDAPADRAAFTPELLRPWLGHIAIVEVERTPVRFRVRLVGTHIVDHDGRDSTGRYLDEIIPAGRHDRVLGPYVRCVEAKAPQYDSLYSNPTNSMNYVMRRLLLPVSVHSRDVDQIIAGIYVKPVDRPPVPPRSARTPPVA